MILIETRTFSRHKKLCRIAIPQSWDEIDTKLQQLFPNDSERGKARKALLDLDEGKALRYFRDSDAAVKAALDALTGSGVPFFANQQLQYCEPVLCAL